MIIGIGTDLILFERMRRVLATDAEPFLRSVYDAAERAEADRRPDRLAYLATRFAAKEAVFKSLGISAEGVRLHEIGIRSESTGKPIVELSGGIAELAAKSGVSRVHLSLSWDSEHAIAYAVAESAI